jgi:hypothetical protein
MGAAFAPALLGMGLVGSAISAIGTYSSMEANAANAAYQAQVAQNNAAIARTNAGLDFAAGDVQSANAEMKTRATVGATKAQEGASGVAVGGGSFSKVRASESELGMLNALTIRSNAAKQGYAQEVAATSEEAQAGLYTMESKEASTAAPFMATGALLSSASTVGLGYARLTQSGTPSGINILGS